MVAGFNIERGLPNLCSSWFSVDACDIIPVKLMFPLKKRYLSRHNSSLATGSCAPLFLRLFLEERIDRYFRGRERLLQIRSKAEKKTPLRNQHEIYWTRCSSYLRLAPRHRFLNIFEISDQGSDYNFMPGLFQLTMQCIGCRLSRSG